MAATIKIKNSSTANAKPTSSDLVQGELAINVTDKKIFTEDSGGNIVELGANFNGFKNRIINGAMVIDQRNAGASVTANGVTYSVDRFWVFGSQTSKFTAQQNAGSVTPPAGFTNYLGITSSSAYSVGSSEQFLIVQSVEGFNTTDLGFGTANASTVTLSFWVRSSLTGTFGGCIQNYATTRSYPFTYTISSANTWEQKTITIAGDTSGTWVGASNAGSLNVVLSLGVGSTLQAAANTWATGNYKSVSGATSVVGTNGATFYITGVQLEKGSTATSFDYRPYGTELQLCQRYYWQQGGSLYSRFGGGIAKATTTSTAATFAFMPAPMRAFPTLTVVGLSNMGINAQTPTAVSVTSVESPTASGDVFGTVRIGITTAGGLTVAGAYELESNGNTSTRFQFSAEL